MASDKYEHWYFFDAHAVPPNLTARIPHWTWFHDLVVIIILRCRVSKYLFFWGSPCELVPTKMVSVSILSHLAEGGGSKQWGHHCAVDCNLTSVHFRLPYSCSPLNLQSSKCILFSPSVISVLSAPPPLFLASKLWPCNPVFSARRLFHILVFNNRYFLWKSSEPCYLVSGQIKWLAAITEFEVKSKVRNVWSNLIAKERWHTIRQNTSYSLLTFHTVDFYSAGV